MSRVEKRKYLLFGAAAAAALAMSHSAKAAMLIYEPFDYTYSASPPTPLSGQVDTYAANPETWWAAGTAAASPSEHQVGTPGLSGGVQPNIGNMADLKNADFKELLRMNIPNAFNTDLTPKYGAGSSLYYSLLLDIPNVSGLTVPHSNANANNAFLIGFNNSQSSGTTATEPNSWNGELAIRLGSAAGTYNLGIRASTTTASTTYWTGDLTPGTTPLFIVAEAQVNGADTDGTNSIWVNPDSSTWGAAVAPTADGSSNGLGSSGGSWSMQSLIIGAGENVAHDAPNDVFMDEIRVGDTWADVTSVPEPSSVALVGLGLMAMAGKRRHRRRST